MKQYKEEHDRLLLEVENIKAIHNTLPDDCFKRPRLEPPGGPNLPVNSI